MPSHAAGPVRDPDLGVTGKSVLHMVALGVTSLSIMPAGRDDHDVLWAAWGDDAAMPRTAHFALLRRGAGIARSTWSMQHEGYSPTIMPMDGWNFGTRGVLLLQYQIGAASSHAEIYGIYADGKPRAFATLEGSLIESAQRDGSSIIEVYQDADLRKPPACYGWDNDRPGLKAFPCAAAAR